MIDLSAVPTPSDSIAWYDVIGKFRYYARKFSEAYNSLVNSRVDPKKYPALASERNDLLRRGYDIKATIQSITSKIDAVYNWIKSIDLNPFDGLGFLPLIPIAVVVASVALMSKFIFDYATFTRRLSEVKRLETRGYSSGQASTIVDKAAGDQSLFNIGRGLPVAFIIGLIGLALAKKKGII